MATKYKRTKTPDKEQLQWCADKFCKILENIDSRCMAADGPVPRTLEEALDSELRLLYRLADKIRTLSKKTLRAGVRDADTRE